MKSFKKALDVMVIILESYFLKKEKKIWNNRLNRREQYLNANKMGKNMHNKLFMNISWGRISMTFNCNMNALHAFEFCFPLCLWVGYTFSNYWHVGMQLCKVIESDENWNVLRNEVVIRILDELLYRWL